MVRSIQDYAKIINSRVTRALSAMDMISLAITVIFLGFFALWLVLAKQNSQIPLSYIRENASSVATTDSRPFASVNGTTYTYSWCSASEVILAKNRIYFENDAAAERSGRSLSKLCQK